MKKRRWKRTLLPCLAALLLLLCLAAAGCHKDDPKEAWNGLRQGMEDRDAAKVAQYMDMDALLKDAYDDSSRELASSVEDLALRYPEDPFFKHTPEFMKEYMAEHRSFGLKLASDALLGFLSGRKPAASFEEQPGSWLSGEFAKLYAATTAELKDIRHEKNDSGRHRAVAVVHLKGDGSAYGNFVDGLELELAMEQQEDGSWKFTRIGNIPSLLLPVTDRAEVYWLMQGW